MAIELEFFPWIEEEEKYSNVGITFSFGQMSEDYYYKMTHLDSTEENYKKYFYNLAWYYDNLITAPTNILGTLTNPEAKPHTFNVPPSEFENGTGNTYSCPSVKYKVNDEITAEVIESVFIGSNSNHKGNVRYTVVVKFQSTNPLYDDWEFPLVFQHVIITEPITYSEFINLTNQSLGQYASNEGFVYSINSYPTNPDKVDLSLTTTGCMINGFIIENDKYRNLNPDVALQGLVIYQLSTQCWGYNGTLVTPYVNNPTANKVKWVPYILGMGYDARFPNSEPEKTVGSYDNSSDKGDIPPLPIQTALQSGMVRMYQMDTTQLNAFADFLWNSDVFENWDSFMNTLKQWFENPLESIISLTISPIDLFYDYKNKIDEKPQPTNVKLAKIDTGVQGYFCTTNQKQISLGTIQIEPYYKNFLDCSPHTKYSIFLPYIGFRDLDADVLYASGGCTLEVVYSIDVMTGVCVANLLIDKKSNGTHLRHVLYSFTGNVNTTIPISSANMTNVINAGVGIISAGVSVGTAIATGGATAPLIASTVSTQAMNLVSDAKPNVAHSGGLSLESGMFGHQYAYLVVTRPREARPKDYKTINGIPSELGGKLSAYAGFTQVSSVHVSIEGATEQEKEEIETLLKAGVIL